MGEILLMVVGAEVSFANKCFFSFPARWGCLGICNPSVT